MDRMRSWWRTDAIAPLCLTLPACALLLLSGCQASQPTGGEEKRAEPLIDVRAADALRKMCDYVAAQKAFSFTVENTSDMVEDDGQKVQYTRRLELDAQRPNHIRAHSTSDEWNKDYWYDGKQVALIDNVAKTYSTVDAPDTIDAMLDFMSEKYGATVPVADFLYSDLNRVLTENILTGEHVGMHSVGGARCHHLAFTQDAVDWQVWIEDGPRPLPRKLVVTYKQQPGSPQFMAVFVDWKMDQVFDAGRFQFTPPTDAQKVEMVPVNAAANGPSAGK